MIPKLRIFVPEELIFRKFDFLGLAKFDFLDIADFKIVDRFSIFLQTLLLSNLIAVPSTF